MTNHAVGNDSGTTTQRMQHKYETEGSAAGYDAESRRKNKTAAAPRKGLQNTTDTKQLSQSLSEADKHSTTKTQNSKHQQHSKLQGKRKSKYENNNNNKNGQITKQTQQHR